VKSLPLAAKDGGEYVADDPANVYAGTYPLARFLYVYVNRAPGKPIDPLVRQFLEFVLSKDGQEIVVKDGYLPLLGKHVAEEKQNLQ
jgi:phosphate transport system substrate-binding protein